MFEYFKCLEGDQQWEWLCEFIAERLHEKFPRFFEEASRIFDEEKDIYDNA